MSEKVTVFDPESKDLQRLPRNKIDGLSSSPLLFPLRDSEDHTLATKFEMVNVPRLRRQFDVYGSNELAKGASHASHKIVTRPTDEIEDKSFLARLYISRLGVTSDVQRLLSSKHRILYIGPLADQSHRTDSDMI